MDASITVAIIPKLERMEKELGKGVERKTTLGMAPVTGLKKEVEGLHRMTDNLTRAVNTNTSQSATLA